MPDVIAHYRIISALGAGGMGEVFLAQDTRLDRKVAMKILSEKVSARSDGLSRFIQEAKAASALNHPNIITVYDIGEFDGDHYIATEFIDGHTLRERMKERLTFDETLSILIQTAEALAAAHDAGIVHRDIKPENVMVRQDGYVKVLDFGLAKLSEVTGETAESEDLTKKLVKTSPGVVMGTASYMSPEQARGKPVDSRSDVFSFGVLMYELLAGRLPFEGETMMDIVSAIITREPPPLQESAEHLPKELVRIVHKSIRKKRQERYQTTRDLLTDLKDLRSELQLDAKLERTAAPNKNSSKTKQSNTHPISSGSDSGIKESLLLTEFENTTGEAIFDHTLKMALSFSLAQSPFLDIVPDAKISTTLKQIGLSPSERVTRKLGEEICLRLNLKAFITGTISTFGSIYILTLEAVSRHGEVIGREYEQVNSREKVLDALGRAASGLREKLGESLSSIEKFDMPGGYTTTFSLEALRLFALGVEQMKIGKTLESLPFYKKALELDPNFAAAYVGLAVFYANTNQWKLAKEMAFKAYEFKDSVSENEKLRIVYFYYSFVTGEMEKAIETLELWQKTFPSHISPYINLSNRLERVGQFEKAVDVAREAVRIASSNAWSYDNLSSPLLFLNRYSEVKDTCQQAFQRDLDGECFHRYLFKVAFIENNAEAMAENLKWFSGRNDEYLALDLQAGAAAFHGKWRSCQDLSRRSIDLAARNGAREVGAQYAAEQALRIVFWSDGSGFPSRAATHLKTVLKTQTNKALNLERGKEAITRAALALACAGYDRDAADLTKELTAEHPKDTLWNELWLPSIKAALCIQRKPKEAIEELQIAERYEKAGEFYPQYLRGLAHLQLNKIQLSVGEFDKILEHRGEAPLSSIYPLAQLSKARALKDKAEYEKFLELWKDADADMPALTAARQEFENM